MVDLVTTTLGEVLRQTRLRLTEAALEDPALEARILVEHFTGTTRAQSLSSPKMPIAAETVDSITAATERRAGGEPVYRIIGCRQFYGLELTVSPATLEPRQDTEALVDETLGFVFETCARKGKCRILDLGTGTGAIALALVAQEPSASAIGVDVSPDALVTACQNAERVGVAERFAPLQSDWFTAVTGRFDLIVSNPPYIPTGMIASLDPEVRDFDPVGALDGGEDGLDCYRHLAGRASSYLEDGGRIAVEIGSDQRLDVAMIFAKAGLTLISERRDLAGNDRVLVFVAGQVRPVAASAA